MSFIKAKLGISKLQFLIKKYIKHFSCTFFQFLVIKTLDPYPELTPEPDSLEMRYPVIRIPNTAPVTKVDVLIMSS
jgi:hypothetical protein